MRRLPEGYFLDRLIQEGKARQQHFDPIVTKLARFYAGAMRQMKVTARPALGVLAFVLGHLGLPTFQRFHFAPNARSISFVQVYASGPFPPAIIIVCGLAGSGKSTVARTVGARTGYQILNSDVVRKQLAGISLTTRSTEDYGKGLYSDSFNVLTYDCLLK